MAQLDNDTYSGDLQIAPAAYVGDTKPALSHEVIATYVADAARSVVGIVDLHTSPWKGLSTRMRETHAQGIVVRDTPAGSVDIEVHAKVAWNTSIPDLAQAVEEAVRERVKALLDIELETVTLFVDQITGPTEAATAEEG